MSTVHALSRAHGRARGVMSAMPVVITGLGPVSAIGCGKTAFWESLVAGRHGFGPITRCDVSQSPSTIGAEVKDFCLSEFIENGAAIARRTPRSVQFALAAGALALHDAKLLPGAGDRDRIRDRDRIGIHIGSSIANLAETFALRDRFLSTGRIAPHTAFNTFNHAAACMLSSLFDLRGPSYTTSTGCNSGMDALGQSLYLLQAGVADGMLVIGTDCELVPELFAVLNASGSLSTRYNDEPGRASRP